MNVSDHADRPAQGTVPASPGFELEQSSGKALLNTSGHHIGPFHLDALQLEVPKLTSPFEVGRGSDGFKRRRCQLRHMRLSLPAAQIGEELSRDGVAAAGLHDLHYLLAKDHFGIGGRISAAGGTTQETVACDATFSLSVAIVPHTGGTLGLVFYDCRVFGDAGIAAATMPSLLIGALGLKGYAEETGPSVFKVDLVRTVLRRLLPPLGWKIPSSTDVCLNAYSINHEGLSLHWADAASESNDDTAGEDAKTPPPPAAAVYTIEQSRHYGTAEGMITGGELSEALAEYRRHFGNETGGRWARDRMLQLACACEVATDELSYMASDVLEEDPASVQARLALTVGALRAGDASRFDDGVRAVAMLSERAGERHEALAAGLAMASLRATTDLHGALALYEELATKERASFGVQRGLFKSKRALGDYKGALLAAESLARMPLPRHELASLHADAGDLCRRQLEDLTSARQQFERALRYDPEHQAALLGLGETFVDRGEPTRAASYLGQLVELASDRSASESNNRNPNSDRELVRWTLRLAELWRDDIGDPGVANEHFERALAHDPTNRSARFALADLARQRGDLLRAQTLLQEICALTHAHNATPMTSEQRADDDDHFIAASLALDEVLRECGNAARRRAEILERILERDSDHPETLARLRALLSELGSGERLVQILQHTRDLLDSPDAEQSDSDVNQHLVDPETTATATSAALTLEIARAQANLAGDHLGAKKTLGDAIASRRYGDFPEALTDLLALLNGEDEPATEAALKWLRVALGHATEPARRAALAAEIDTHLVAQGADFEERFTNLITLLDASPSDHGAAVKLIDLFATHVDDVKRAEALQRLAEAALDDDEQGRALLDRGKLLAFELDDAITGIECLTRATRLCPAVAAGWLSLAQAQRTVGSSGDALDTLTAGLAAVSPVDEAAAAALHEQSANLYSERGELSHEIEHLEQVIAIGGLEAVVCERLLEALVSVGSRPRAAELMESWAPESVFPNPDDLLLRAARLRLYLGQHRVCIDLCEGILGRAREQQHRASPNAAAAADLLEEAWTELGDLSGLARAIDARLGACGETLQSHERIATMERLVAAWEQASESANALDAAQALLAEREDSRPGNAVVATHAAQRGDWVLEYSGWRTYLRSHQVPDAESPAAAVCPDLAWVFGRALTLAEDVAPSEIEDLRRLYQIERRSQQQEGFSGERLIDDELSSTPLSTGLHKEERWDELASLLAWQNDNGIVGATRFPQVALADLLFRKLNGDDEAISLLQPLVNAGSDTADNTAPDTELVDAAMTLLGEIFAANSRHLDLAELGIRRAQACSNAAEAIAIAIQPLEIYGSLAPEHANAALEELANRFRDDPAALKLLPTAWAVERFDIAADLLTASLSHDDVKSAEDPRFGELLWLLNNKLDQPDIADEMCQRYSQSLGDNDVFWELWLQLCGDAEDSANIPRRVKVIEAHAAQRTEMQAAGIYLLARAHYDQLGDAESAARAQLQAVESFVECGLPPDTALLEELVRRLLALGRSEAALKWQRQLAALDVGDDHKTQRERLRVVVELATGPVDDADAARWALERLCPAEPEENRRLADLLVAAGDIGGVDARLRENVIDLSTNAALACARHFVASGDAERAKPYLQALLDAALLPNEMPSGDALVAATLGEIWKMIGDAWTATARREELGQWRLNWADQTNPECPCAARLLGALDIIDERSADYPEHLTGLDIFTWPQLHNDVAYTPSFALETELAALDYVGLGRAARAGEPLEDRTNAPDEYGEDAARLLWSAFVLAGRADLPTYFGAATEALHVAIAAEDVRRIPVLATMLKRAREAGDDDRAIAAARELAALDVEGAEKQLEECLANAGREDELVVVLAHRAERCDPGMANDLWMQIANMHLTLGDADAAWAALQRVGEDDRDISWAETVIAYAENNNDAEARAHAAEVYCRLERNPEIRAEWMRRLARLLKWELGQETRADDLFAAASKSAPLSAESVAGSLTDAEDLLEAGDAEAARRIAVEMLLSAPPSASGLLILSRTLTVLARTEEAMHELHHAAAVLHDTGEAELGDGQAAALWDQIAAHAQTLADSSMQVDALQRAYELTLEAHSNGEDTTTPIAATSVDDSLVTYLLVAAHLGQGWRIDESIDAGMTRVAASASAEDTDVAGSWAVSIYKRLADGLDAKAAAAIIFGAAQRRADNGDPHEATAELLRLALTLGHNSVAADRLGESCFAGDEAAASILRLLQREVGDDNDPTMLKVPLGGGERWQLCQRLSTLRLEQNDIAAASQALELASPELHPDTPRARWVQMQEEILSHGLTTPLLTTPLPAIESGDEFTIDDEIFAAPDSVAHRDLAQLWLRQATTDDDIWQGSERARRLRLGALHYRAVNDPLSESRMLAPLLDSGTEADGMAILERLVRLAAELDDAETFEQLVDQQLKELPTCASRRDAALSFAPVLSQRFELHQKAATLLRECFDEEPVGILVEHLRELPALGDHVDLTSQSATDTSQAERAEEVNTLYQQLIEQRLGGLQKLPHALLGELSRPLDYCAKFAADNELWDELVDLLRLRSSKRLGDEPDPDEVAAVCDDLRNEAVVCLERLGDVPRAEIAIKRALELQPEDQGSRDRLVEMQLASGEVDDLFEQLKARVLAADREIDVSLLVSNEMREQGLFDAAGEVLDWLIATHPDSPQAAQARLGRARETGDAEALLEAITRLTSHQGSENEEQDQSDEERAKLLYEAAGAASELDSAERSRALLEEVCELSPEWSEPRQDLIANYEAAGDYTKSCALRENELAGLADEDQRLARTIELEKMVRVELGNDEQALRLLEQAANLRPDNNQLLTDLLRRQHEANNRERYLDLGATLVSRDAVPDDVALWLYDELGKEAEEQGDSQQAHDYLQLALAGRPDDSELTERLRDMSRSTEDWESFAKCESALLNEADHGDLDETLTRYYELAAIYSDKLGDQEGEKRVIERGRELIGPKETQARALADKLAQQDGGYRGAREIYAALYVDPLDAQLGLILARICGQAQDAERAWAYYAAIASIYPGDEEAGRYIDACRGVATGLPHRALSAADYDNGLAPEALSGDSATTQVGIIGIIDTLITGLAPLLGKQKTERVSLEKLGVSENDRLSPTDVLARSAIELSECIGLGPIDVCMWRGGGLDCEVVLDTDGRPTVLLGAAFASQLDGRARAFLLMRAMELFRTGRYLCKSASTPEIARELAVLAKAVNPEAEPPALQTDGRRRAEALGSEIDDELRARLLPMVTEYCESGTLSDVRSWRDTAPTGANRVAMTCCCDLPHALDALLGIDGGDGGRRAQIEQSTEGRDLLGFGVSREFIALRSALGLSLQTQ